MSRLLETLRRLSSRRRVALKWTLAVTVAAGALGYGWYFTTPLFVLEHLPGVYMRRDGELSANVTGRMSRWLVRHATFRLNDGPELPVGQGWPRAPSPNATLELLPSALRSGENHLVIDVTGWLRPAEHIERTFRYDPESIALPLEVRWNVGQELDVQDGVWETVERDGRAWVRPKPGHEGYDRMLLVTGSFAVNRRIETEVVFRKSTIGPFHVGAREYGFGVLSLWGGHPDASAHRPRRGWSFAMSWFWSKPGGVGNEISFRRGADPASWIGGYRDFDVEPGVSYTIEIEVRRKQDSESRGYVEQRTRWFRTGTPAPSGWLVLDDRAGGTLPKGNYGVALLAFNSQVEFGALRIEPLL